MEMEQVVNLSMDINSKMKTFKLNTMKESYLWLMLVEIQMEVNFLLQLPKLHG